MELMQDVRHALRGFRNAPLFTAIAAITLALGIGATTAVFSVVDALLLRGLPYPDAERLVTIRSNVSLPDLESIREGTHSFSAIGASTSGTNLDMTGRGEPVRAHAAMLDVGLFAALGARPALGRLPGPADDRFGGERTVVLSHAFFTSRFGGDPAVLGTAIDLGGFPYSVVGVLASSFRLPGDADVYTPLRVAYPDAAKYRGVHFMRSYLKLAPGKTLAAAQVELDAVAKHLSDTYPDQDRNIQLKLVPLSERVLGDSKTIVLVLFGAVGLVLLVASANFAGLLLARTIGRRRELALRAALGAGRARTVRLLVTESVLLAVLGGGLGALLAPALLSGILALRPDALSPLFEIRLDLTVLAFAALSSVVTGILFGLIPALRFSKPGGAEELAEGARGSAGPGRTRLQAVLVTAEVALALVLAVGAGLLGRTFQRLASVDPGFSPEHLVTMRVELPEARYKEIPEQNAFRRRLFEELRGLPFDAGAVSELPLGGAWIFHNTIVEGAPAVAEGAEPEIQSRSIDGDYFGAMKIRLSRGRAFEEADRENAPLVAVVNESFAKQQLAGREPLGARVRWARTPQPQWMTIVGVVGDVSQFGLDKSDQPAIYTPYAQLTQSWKRWMDLVVRGDGEPAAIAKAVVERVHRADPLLAVTDVKTMREVVASSLGPRRFALALLAAFAGLAVFLAALGLYGVLSNAVAQRTREIGVRVALGATPADVLSMVVRQGARFTGIGLALGLLGALACTRFLKSMVWGTSTADPVTYLVLTTVVAAVALLASALPALRASRVDPIVALREE
jgi:putative ABC transport system permease protein